MIINLRMMANPVTFILIAVQVLLYPQLISSLKCYECGHYLPRSDGSDRFVPCDHYNSSHLTKCKPHEKSCLRLSNQGLILLQCSANCNPDINRFAEREIHCCDQDGCNGSSFLSSSISFCITLISLNVLIQLMSSIVNPSFFLHF